MCVCIGVWQHWFTASGDVTAVHAIRVHRSSLVAHQHRISSYLRRPSAHTHTHSKRMDKYLFVCLYACKSLSGKCGRQFTANLHMYAE